MTVLTVAQRWALVRKALPSEPARVATPLGELLYTASEAGVLDRMEVQDALLIWRMVELAKSGGVTPDMKL